VFNNILYDKWDGNMILNSIRGFCMALADSIPGVSGGTIAYILGFYDKFLTSINDIFSKNKLKQTSSWIFLAQLIIGWIIGMVLSILILSSLFTNHIYFMSSLLIGLTISSIPLIFIEEKQIFSTKIKDLVKYFIFFIIGITLMLFVSLNSQNMNNGSIVLTNIDFQLGLKLVVAGMLAISTMILPGISGSSLLVIFKLYLPIINALKQLMSLNFSYLLAVLLFGSGILIGAVSTVKIVKTALLKHRSATISFIFGLIIAAIYSIIIGPTTLEIPQLALSISTFNVIGFLLGVAIIILLQKLNHSKKSEF
jgi:putative membrane protein